MAYFLLVAAIAAEVAGTSLLKASEGFTRLWPTVGTLAGFVLSFVLLAQTVKSLPIGLVYATWAGLGTVSIVAIGVAFLGEAFTPSIAIGVALVVAGVVILNLGGAQ